MEEAETLVDPVTVDESGPWTGNDYDGPEPSLHIDPIAEIGAPSA